MFIDATFILSLHESLLQISKEKSLRTVDNIQAGTDPFTSLDMSQDACCMYGKSMWEKRSSTPYTLDALPCVLRYTTTRLGNGENPKYKMTSSSISQDARRTLTRACFRRLAIYQVLTIYLQRYIDTENLLYRRSLVKNFIRMWKSNAI